jgi:leader peptidase (prepilin peptidase)/N-methyltransferase
MALVLFGVMCGLLGGWITNRWVHSIVEAPDGDYAIEVAPSCPRCGTEVTLAAVAPWLQVTDLGRKCTTCAEDRPSSWFLYPLACAAACGASALVLGNAPILPAMMLLCIIGVAAATVDIRTMLIPKKLAWGGLAVGSVAVVATSVWMWAGTNLPFEPYFDRIKSAFLGAAIYLGLFLVIALISPRGIGLGDVRLAAVLGLYLGWIDLRLVLWGILIGSIAGLIVGLASRRMGDRSQPYPYGPGMVVGTVVAIWLNSVLLAS